MNLKVKTQNIELEITNGDVNRVERALVAIFQYLEGGSFAETFETTEAELRPVNSKRNFTPTIDGIKEFNGEKHYQCSYHCPCGDRGVRFLKEDASVTTCHKCKTTLNVIPASENEAHDKDFNYFIAY